MSPLTKLALDLKAKVTKAESSPGKNLCLASLSAGAVTGALNVGKRAAPAASAAFTSFAPAASKSNVNWALFFSRVRCV
jgi:hypothetical protein